MSSILITGANGFIGKKICEKFLQLNIDYIPISSKNGDLCNIETLNKFDFTKISLVIHTAAKTYVPESWINPEIFLKNNVNSTVNILEKCKQYKIPLLFFSAFIYDSNNELPLKENSKLKSFNPYALSKKISEEICEFYSKEFDIPMTILRPFNIYGESQNNKFLIPSIINQVIHKNQIIVESLNTKRDYIHIDDLVSACIIATKNISKFKILNVGSGVSYGIIDIINILENYTENKIEIINKNINRKNEIFDIIADISYTKLLLNWEPKIKFEDGIINMFQELKKIKENGN